MVKNDQKFESGRLVHEFLAHSYLIYFGAVIVGFAADIIWPVKFSFPYQQIIGFVFIVLGTILAVWAQYASGKGGTVRYAAGDKVHRSLFKIGPYMFTRTPTQYGLSAMLIGLALLYGYTFLLATTVIAFLAGKFHFIPKQEHHLEKKYGAAYLEYKKDVKI